MTKVSVVGQRGKRMNYFKLAIMLFAIAGFCDFLIMLLKRFDK
jgi:hypothetical protein